MATDDGCPYPHGRRCTEDGCTDPATAKRPEGVTPDGALVTVAVCDRHRAVPD